MSNPKFKPPPWRGPQPPQRPSALQPKVAAAQQRFAPQPQPRAQPCAPRDAVQRQAARRPQPAGQWSQPAGQRPALAVQRPAPPAPPSAAGRTPAAPPVYRPQPTPLVLQRRTALPPAPPTAARPCPSNASCAGSHTHRPAPAGVVRPPSPPAPAPRSGVSGANAAGVAQPKTAQGFAPRAHAARQAQGVAPIQPQRPRPPAPARDAGTIQRAWDKRPGFTTAGKKSAYLHHNLFSESDFTVDINKPGLTDVNGAMPHRYPWFGIRESTKKFVKGTEDEDDFNRWTDRFVNAGEEKIEETKEEMEATSTKLEEGKEEIKRIKKRLNKAKKKKEKDELGEKLKRRKKRRKSLKERDEDLKELLKYQEISQKDFVDARDELVGDTTDTGNRKEFLKHANSFHANVSGIGPHKGCNNPVRENLHLNLRKSRRDKGDDEKRGRKRKRSLSPGSRAASEMSPTRVSSVATDNDGNIITVTGEAINPKKLHRKDRKKVNKHGTKVIKSFNPDAPFG